MAQPTATRSTIKGQALLIDMKHMQTNDVSQEYFEEDTIREKYTSTLARIFLALGEPDSEGSQNLAPEAGLWPPFPWPRTLLRDGSPIFVDIIMTAWGDDDNEEPNPAPKKSAKELASAVVHFEREIAHASLDLCVSIN